MAEPGSRGIELLPGSKTPRQLFILLHGVGAQPADLLPLATQLRDVFADAAFLIPEGAMPFDGGGEGRQWFSLRGVTEENRVQRVAEAMPALSALVRNAQDRLQVLPSDTALVGFSQGAIMALEMVALHDGSAGRVLAFAGRYARLPERAPELTTLHLLHGEDDTAIPLAHAYAAYETLSALGGDVTLDTASSIGHELHPALIERAIHRLQTCIPLRSWRRALDSA